VETGKWVGRLLRKCEVKIAHQRLKPLVKVGLTARLEAVPLQRVEFFGSC
jgi:hypothetical protein